MSTGNTQIETITTPAPAGVFCGPDELGLTTAFAEVAQTFQAPGANAHSAEFWRKYKDFMPEAVGYVLQVAVDHQGRLLPTEDKPLGSAVLGLIFDARRVERHIYGWQLSYAQGSQRRVTQITSKPWAEPGLQYVFDSYGRLAGNKVLHPREGLDYARLIQAMTGHPSIAENAEKVRARREKAQRQIENAGDNNRLQERLQGVIEKTGFVALQPFKLTTQSSQLSLPFIVAQH